MFREWLRGIGVWLNPRNWLAETAHQELFRRLRAVEDSVQEAHLRLNTANTALNKHMATPLLDGSHMELDPPGGDAMHYPGEQIPGDGNS